MIGPASLEHYRQRLEELIERHGGRAVLLRQDTAHGLGGESGGGLSNAPTHQADLGTAHHDEEVGLMLAENQEYLLAECQSALARLRAGTFGLCERCFENIPGRRLEVFPHARYCVGCAREAEDEQD